MKRPKREKKKFKRWQKIVLAAASPFMAVAVLVGGLFAHMWLTPIVVDIIYPGERDRLNDTLGAPGWFRGFSWYNKLFQTNDWRRIVDEPQPWPNMDGSTVMVPMAVEFARQHLGLDAKAAQERILFSTTHYAYQLMFTPSDDKWVIASMPDLVLGTAPGEEELKIARENGIAHVQKPVCRDAFVFITGKDNPVDSLTLEQVRGIFSGEITNWKGVGGADEKILAYQRESGSGSQTGMEQLVMQGVPMADPKTVKLYDSMSGLMDAVAEYENSARSIGYSYRYYIDNQYSKENVKQLQIEGIAPTDENIINGKYPLSVNYYGVIRAGEEDGPGGLFLDWILSEEGQACVKQAGYIPLGADNAEHGDLYDINQSIDQAHLDSIGATVLRKEVMPYREYLAQFDDGRDTSIKDDQRVWVVQIHFPNGFETRAGMFENAVTTSLYDAETGFYYGFSVTGGATQ